jgi:hypothetical protein
MRPKRLIIELFLERMEALARIHAPIHKEVIYS